MHNLSTKLQDGNVRLEPLGDEHIEPLRAACAEDLEIWDIYPVNMLGKDFDVNIGIFRALPSWVCFAVINVEIGKVVGMTNYLNPSEHGTVEIGGTYIIPSQRGAGLNDVMKKLLIENAFDNGFHKVEFRVDSRNKRSQAAVLKLGAKHEGTLRQNMKTWTGYIRDSFAFGLLKDEWER